MQTQYLEDEQSCQFCGTEMEEIFLPNDQSEFACRTCDLGVDY